MQKVCRALFILLMICAVVTVLWYIPMSLSIAFNAGEIGKDLDTSLKREEKQRYEYNQVITDLPLVREELAEKQPLAEAATAQIAALKEERKRLRAEKKELEAVLTEDTATVTADNTDKGGTEQ